MTNELQSENSSGSELQRKISRYQNSVQPKYSGKNEPGPNEIYINPHKKRGKSKTKIFEHAQNFLRQKKIIDAVNTEKMTPLDEYPEFGYDHD